MFDCCFVMFYCNVSTSLYLQDEIFKKGIHEISRLYNQSDKEG